MINEELLTEAQRSSGCRTDEFVAKFGNFISLEELTQQKEQDIYYRATLVVFLSILGGVALYYSYAQFMACRTRK